MTKGSRILAVTFGLLGVGAAAGALAGAAVAALIVALLEGPRAAFNTGVLQVGAAFGAPLGAVLLPLASWLLMRRVPIGRALLGTVAGTIAGGLIGWFAPGGTDEIARTLILAVAGFVVAVVALRRSASAQRPQESALRAVPSNEP